MITGWCAISALKGPLPKGTSVFSAVLLKVASAGAGQAFLSSLLLASGAPGLVQMVQMVQLCVDGTCRHRFWTACGLRWHAGCMSPAAQDVACWSVLASTVVRLKQAACALTSTLLCLLVCHCLPAAVCAMMSTADSALLAFSSMWVKDLFVPYIRPQATQQQQIWFGRAMSVVGLSIGVALGEWAAGTEEEDGYATRPEQAQACAGPQQLP